MSWGRFNQALRYIHLSTHLCVRPWRLQLTSSLNASRGIQSWSPVRRQNLKFQLYSHPFCIYIYNILMMFILARGLKISSRPWCGTWRPTCKGWKKLAAMLKLGVSNFPLENSSHFYPFADENTQHKEPIKPTVCGPVVGTLLNF